MLYQLQRIKENFKHSRTSLESYEAIADFVKIIKTIPGLVEQIEKEGEKIRIEQRKLNADKGWHLKRKEQKSHNERRAAKGEALHQLNPLFPFGELHNVFLGIQPDQIADNAQWLFFQFSPDDPLPAIDKKEYQLFIDKIYKKALFFLNEEEKIEFGFDSEKSILYFQAKAIHISLKNDKTNAHYVLEHIFKDDDLTQRFPFREMAEDTFQDFEYNWRKYYRACEDISKKVYKVTKIDDFLDFSTGEKGWVTINKKYLK